MTDLFTRFADNPVLRAKDWPYPVNTVFNAGATRLADGQVLLLARVEDRRGISHLCAARSRDGVRDWQIDHSPTLAPQSGCVHEQWGLEDPRIVFLQDKQAYAITYTSYSRFGPGVSLSLTTDFRHFEQLGQILLPENKDAALLPDKINGQWAMIHRPVPFSVPGAHIWLSFSDDLIHWGQHTVLLESRGGPTWDGAKVGLSPPLIPTNSGWLMMYHGARGTVSSTNYYIGLALLDRNDPRKVLQRANDWVLGPQETYERSGDVDNVVFPCGYTVADDLDTLRIYYGAADTSIGIAEASIQELLRWLQLNQS